MQTALISPTVSTRRSIRTEKSENGCILIWIFFLFGFRILSKSQLSKIEMLVLRVCARVLNKLPVPYMANIDNVQHTLDLNKLRIYPSHRIW